MCSGCGGATDEENSDDGSKSRNMVTDGSVPYALDASEYVKDLL